MHRRVCLLGPLPFGETGATTTGAAAAAARGSARARWGATGIAQGGATQEGWPGQFGYEHLSLQTRYNCGLLLQWSGCYYNLEI
jgi:hypothetical protein